MVMLRAVLATLLALPIGVQVIRSAAVDALAERNPAASARAWPGHPAVDLSLGLTAIAEATRQRKAVSAVTFDLIFDASRKAPLAPGPFLVRGVQAQLSGNVAVAEQAFLAAKWRDGRSRPARYFLADHYFRHGDASRGIREIAALANLIPNGPESLAPYMAAYAKDRSNWPQLKAIFRSDSSLELSTLFALSAEASNADAVLALANPRSFGPKVAWLERLLSSLTGAGEYMKARKIWASVSHVRLGPGTLVFDPEFTRSDAPPPFNWALTSSAVGSAERRRGGGLQVIFYGQQDGVLASQLLVLPPGRYRLNTKVSASASLGATLRWKLTCAGANSEIASLPLGAAAGRPSSFVVPASCAAQRLELVGSSADIPRQSEATIHSVSVSPESPDA